MRRKHYIVACLLIFTLASAGFASPFTQQLSNKPRRYRVGAVDELEMTVPIDWQESSKTLDAPPAVTLAYRLPSKKNFYMKVTTAWESQQERSSRDPDWLRQAVERTGLSYLSSSTQSSLNLTEIRGPNVRGYYFQLPRKEKLPIGEFKYITQGAVDLGKVTLVFTIFSTEKEMAAISNSLRVIESARFIQAE